MNTFSKFKDKVKKMRQTIKGYGVSRAVSRWINSLLWPVITFGLFYKIEFRLQTSSVKPLENFSENLIFHHLGVDEILSKKHYFSEDRLSAFVDRILVKKVNIFCLLTEDESEILGFFVWTDHDFFDENIGRTVCLSSKEVYAPELSVNPKYHGINYGNYILQNITMMLKKKGYTSMIGFTSWDNIPSIAAQKRYGGVIVKKYLEFHVNLNCIIPLAKPRFDSQRDKSGRKMIS